MIEPRINEGTHIRTCLLIPGGSIPRLGWAFALGAMLAVAPVMPVQAEGEPVQRQQPATPLSEGRFIVYLDEATAARFADESLRPAMLTEWESRLSGTVQVERRLATGGWVLTVRSQSPVPRTSELESLEGVTAVEADALMRPF